MTANRHWDLAKNKSTEKNYVNQFRALFLKSFAIQKRSKAQNCCQILTPVFMLLLLFGIQAWIGPELANTTDDIQHPTIWPLFLTLPRPDPDDDNWDIEDYLPDQVTTILTTTASKSFRLEDLSHRRRFTIRLVDSTTVNDANAAFSDDFDDNPNYTLSDVPYVFKYEEDSDEIDSILYNTWKTQWNHSSAFEVTEANFAEVKFSGLIYGNSSLTDYADLPTTWSLVSSAFIYNVTNGERFFLLNGTKFFPTQEESTDFDIATLMGSFFYMLILQQLLPVFLQTLVYEKEQRLREYMKMMGLSMTIYWIVNYMFFFMLYFVLVLFLSVFGYLMQFRVFTINDPGVYILLFFFWGHTLIAMVIFMSSFFNHTKTATIVGYFFILVVTFFATYLIDTEIQDLDTDQSLLALISLFPPFALYRGLAYLSMETSFQGPGIKMGDVSDSQLNMSAVWGFMIAEWAFFLLAAWYTEQVLPSGYGIKRNPLFFLEKSYWFPPTHTGPESSTSELLPTVQTADEESHEEVPEDVQNERTRAFENHKAAVRILNIRKVYPAEDDNPEKVAVHRLAMCIEPGECMGLLGHNGAGKTTLINMLCGLIPATTGTAKIFGFDLNTEIDRIHMIMGVCPQHDILWEGLTGREHLLFFGRLKNLHGQELQKAVKDGLASVELTAAGNKKVGKYSGGMKRRLSVAVSLIGNPRVVFLDEPSTGLDPASKRTLWTVINKHKNKASMILTTHSMEEADALCDRLAMFGGGKLQTIGVSSDLKARWGSGFKLSVQGRAAQAPVIEQFIHALCPHARKLNELAGAFNFELPREGTELSEIFEGLESRKEELGIIDWGISNTTLEEVFLKVNGH